MKNKNNKSRKKVGLALGGGGAKGLSHIGVIKMLERHNIPIDFIAGTSIGALVGGVYAAFKNSRYIEELVEHSDIRQFISVMWEPTNAGGLVRGTKVLKFIEDELDGVDFEDLHIPLAISATNLITGSTEYFEKKGNVAQAIRASISYPLVFAPLHRGKAIYVDGGISVSVPSSKAREMGADVVVSVNLEDDYAFDSRVLDHSITRTFNQAMRVLQRTLAAHDCESADIVISPKVGKFKVWRDFDKGGKLIAVGEDAAHRALPKIKKLLA